MSMLPTLLPAPRNLKFTGDECTLVADRLILLQADQPQIVFPFALMLQNSLRTYYPGGFEISAAETELAGVAITLHINLNSHLYPQAYRLKIHPEGIKLEAGDEPGMFYACCTLLQLMQYYFPLLDSKNDSLQVRIPCLEIDDWPDFPNRGVLLDISRDKVPSTETIFDLVDLLASWKINQLQLYTEHTFAYRQHPEVWAEASPFTGEEILKLDRFCKERFIELVPNQNSFGHMERWLNLPRYKPLAEAPDGFDFPWGHHDGPFSLCPVDEASLSFLSGLYDELLPHFTSRQFNVGCDETFDLGQGRSKSECERLGSGRVYLDFLLKIYEQVTKRSHRMQFWGDIIMAHPELVPELPKDSVALEWGYEADHPFDEHGAKFAQAGLTFYVCPGTSSWNSIAGRTDNCLGNLANAAQNGLKHGAEGYLITDWGDNGHWQALPVSYLGFAAGAAYAWCFASNRGLDVTDALNRYAFHDAGGGMGRMAYDLGNVYRQVGLEPPNASALFYVLQQPYSEWKDYLDKETAIQAFHHTFEFIDQVSHHLSNSSSQRDDQRLLQREFRLTNALLRHACSRALYLYGSTEYSPKYLVDELDIIVDEFRQLWLARNRPGGLRDSLARFALTKTDYH